MEEIIAVKHLTFSYGSTLVLRDVSFCIKKGSFAILLGQNGAGKSTLLKLLLGELKPSGAKEEIRVFGQDVRRFKDWNRLSYVPQSGLAAYVNFPASVEEIVQANLYKEIGLFRFPGKKEHAAVMATLSLVGMEAYAKRLIGNLSGGQRQRVLLARALVSRPQLLILDEPTAGMDERSTNEFLALLRKINQEQGVTILMVTHDRKRMSAMADEAWLLEDGETERVKEAKEVREVK